MVSKTPPQAWLDWCHSCGQGVQELHTYVTFDHFYLLIQAIKWGIGVANVPRMLVRDDLSSGALVAPLGFAAGPNRLVIWVAQHLSRRADTVKLVDWLTDELRASEL